MLLVWGALVATPQARAATRLPLQASETRDVSLDMRANLEARDGSLVAQVSYSFSTTRPAGVRWTERAPLPLPLLAPAVRDVVVDRGVMPLAAKHVRIQAPPGARVLRDDDSLWLVGEVAPRRKLQLQIEYPIATARQDIRLGVRGVVGRTELVVGVVAVAPARPRLESVRWGREAEQVEGQERMTALALHQPLRSGETAIVLVSDLPAPADWPRRTLAGLFGLVLALSLAALWHALASRRAGKGP